MNGQYTSIASFYDKLNSEVNYPEWAGFLHDKIKKNGIKDGSIVLDIACGTGTIATLLSDYFDVIGIDNSAEMLNIAREKDQNGKILWLLQDMTEFELYGTVGAIVCCLDSVNYILKKDKLNTFFALCRNYLDDNGVLIFDINSPYKFKNVYGNNHFILEDENVFCGWKNYFNEKTGFCDFELSFFAENDGVWERFDECQREKMWSPKTIDTLLKNNGFEIIEKVENIHDAPISETSERIHYICKKA